MAEGPYDRSVGWIGLPWNYIRPLKVNTLIPTTLHSCPASGARPDNPAQGGAIPLAVPSGKRKRRRGEQSARVLVHLLIALYCWTPAGDLFAQEESSLRDSISEFDESPGKIVPDENHRPTVGPLDSLRFQAFEIEIEQAQLEVMETDFLHRMIPQMHFSASMGFKDLFFADPSNNVLSVLPKDAYRLSLTLPINEVFGFSKHRWAELKLFRLQLEYARIRQQQREMAKRRMMSEIPNADVVITNPTHYAVAIKYSGTDMRAPIVVAKGIDVLALKIREIASDNHLPLLESPKLARALYAHTELGDEIPEALYMAVAEVLAYVFQLRSYKTGEGEYPELKNKMEVPDELDPLYVETNKTSALEVTPA